LRHRPTVALGRQASIGSLVIGFGPNFAEDRKFSNRLLGGVNDLKPLGKGRPNIALLGSGSRFDQLKELERLGAIGLASRRRKKVERRYQGIARLKQVLARFDEGGLAKHDKPEIVAPKRNFRVLAKSRLRFVENLIGPVPSVVDKFG
jgi:hypothetical protein